MMIAFRYHKKLRHLVMRDNLTSYTEAMFIKNESKPTLRDAVIVLSSKLKNNIVPTTLRVDSHSFFKSMNK